MLLMNLMKQITSLKTKTKAWEAQVRVLLAPIGAKIFNRIIRSEFPLAHPSCPLSRRRHTSLMLLLQVFEVLERRFEEKSHLLSDKLKSEISPTE